jgi:hypothetical protein
VNRRAGRCQPRRAVLCPRRQIGWVGRAPGFASRYPIRPRQCLQEQPGLTGQPSRDPPPPECRCAVTRVPTRPWSRWRALRRDCIGSVISRSWPRGEGWNPVPLPPPIIRNETTVSNAFKGPQSSSLSPDFAEFSLSVSALITVWLEVRVLPGPPIFSTTCRTGVRRRPGERAVVLAVGRAVGAYRARSLKWKNDHRMKHYFLAGRGTIYVHSHPINVSVGLEGMRKHRRTKKLRGSDG